MRRKKKKKMKITKMSFVIFAVDEYVIMSYIIVYLPAAVEGKMSRVCRGNEYIIKNFNGIHASKINTQNHKREKKLTEDEEKAEKNQLVTICVAFTISGTVFVPSYHMSFAIL